MIKIELLRCFSVVAETGNLADASVRLGRTQSAVSMSLKRLADHLGQPLFEGERKNTLTPLGEEIFLLAQKQLRMFDETTRAMERTASAPQGLLRIASVPSVAGLVFPTAIEELTQRHAGLKVELRDTDSDLVVDALLRGQADIGIASGEPQLNGIQQELLFEDAFGLICAPGHALARQSQVPTIDQVLSSGVLRNNLCSLLETTEVVSALNDVRVSVYNTLSLISMVRTGKWITILPSSVVRIMPDELIFRPIAGLSERRAVSLLTRERPPFPRYARELGDILRSYDF